MEDRLLQPAVADEVPWAESLTAYDNEHFRIYLRLIDACAGNASEEEMAQAILGIDSVREPARAQKAVRSHLARAHWLVIAGYKELFASQEA
ncbi:DUF2285 domain-containing protein [Mesorhizobium sp. C280B]|uniref:DNA -binding domain-containing protein n=1 Tax=unclassified Mesorhizobium TaxID=325217 RepID=UPI0003CE256A|nr:DUF2285 domain-containing protein [Mesorhizobium sp. LSJC280B00]ESW64078.1 hypothetical protein X772_36090 [Mesorhizobium sp. LSJC280B00]